MPSAYPMGTIGAGCHTVPGLGENSWTCDYVSSGNCDRICYDQIVRQYSDAEGNRHTSPPPTPPPQRQTGPQVCTPAKNGWQKAADFLDQSSNALSSLAFVSLGAAVVTSETGVGLVGFGAAAGALGLTSKGAAALSVAINVRQGRLGNAAVTTTGQLIGFGVERSGAKAIAKLGLSQQRMFNMGKGALGQYTNAVLGCP